MTEQDTVRLLRECDAGIKMGIEAIDQVEEVVGDPEFKCYLIQCKDKHLALQDQLQTQLDQHHDEGKEPNPVAKGMSWMKTNVKLGVDSSDQTVADLITDGCNMGVKSLNRYLNQYKAADSPAREIARDLIALESNMTVEIRKYL